MPAVGTPVAVDPLTVEFRMDKVNPVFLQHLGPLSSLPTFTALWLTILDFLAQFVSTASSDLLADALPESLKNMLLVMDTSGRNLFFTGQKK